MPELAANAFPDPVGICAKGIALASFQSFLWKKPCSSNLTYSPNIFEQAP